MFPSKLLTLDTEKPYEDLRLSPRGISSLLPEKAEPGIKAKYW